MFLMTPLKLGKALPAWLPPSAASFKRRAKPDPAARGRRLAGGWLRHLGDVGVRLLGGIRELARLRDETGRVEVVPIDLQSGWALVRRATCWMAALRFRLVAEAAAARLKNPPAKPDQLALLLAAAEADANAALPRRRPKRGRARVESHEVRYHTCIDGISTAAALAQICADLGAASTVLIEPDARRLVEAIAVEARTLLGESEVALLPPPKIVSRLYAMPPQQGAMPKGAISGVAPPPPAPGTG
jgi:hypothetical protein